MRLDAIDTSSDSLLFSESLRFFASAGIKGRLFESECEKYLFGGRTGRYESRINSDILLLIQMLDCSPSRE